MLLHEVSRCHGPVFPTRRSIDTSINYQPAGKQVHAWTLRKPVGVVAAIVSWNSPLVFYVTDLGEVLTGLRAAGAS